MYVAGICCKIKPLSCSFRIMRITLSLQRMRFLEKVFALMALAGVLMNLLTISGGRPVIALALICLAVLYLLGGVLLFNDVRIRACFKKSSYTNVTFTRVAISLLASGILSLSIAGILYFLVYGYNNPKVVYAIGSINLLFTIILVILQSSKHLQFYRNILTRTFVVLIVMGCMVITPSKYLGDWQKSRVISMSKKH